MSETEHKLIDDGKVMSLFEHLDELRFRIIRSLWGIVILFCVAFYFSNPILEFLKIPLLKSLPEGTTSIQALHFTSPMDVMMVQMRVGILAAIIFGAPWWLFQFWKFFEPALYPKERKYILPFVVASVGLFYTGMSFCYYAMLPLAMKYLIGIGIEVGTPMITVTDYIAMITILFLGFGFVFETPVILVLLAMIDIISADTLATYRRHSVVATLIISALIVPPDPVSQVLMAVPMYAMYEASIWIIRLLKREKPKT